MLFQIEDSRLQRQMDLVREEQTQVRLLRQLLDGQEMLSEKPGRILERLEAQTRKRLQFLEDTRAACLQLQADVDRTLDRLTLPE